MKYIVCLIIFISFNLYADVTNQDIDKVCLKHAVSLVNHLNTEIMVDINQIQSDKILELTTENCKQHFYDAENENITKAKNIEQSDKEDTEDKEDWFTEKILTGEVPDKAGNKRLKRRGH